MLADGRGQRAGQILEALRGAFPMQRSHAWVGPGGNPQIAVGILE